MGPLFGGLLVSVDFGGDFENWRATFFVIAGLTFIIWMITLVFMDETLSKKSYETPTCPNPFAPLVYLKYFRISLLIVCLSISFAGFFAVNISFPRILASEFGFNPMIVGLCYLPFGAGLILGTVIGGRSADAIRRNSGPGGTPEHRLLPSLLFIPLNAIGIAAQGWVFELSPNLGLILFLSFFLGMTFILPRPGTNTYAIEKLKILTHQDVASSATGLIFGVMLPLGAVIAQLSVIGVEELGYGIYLSIVGGLLFLSVFPVSYFTLRSIRKAKAYARLVPGNKVDQENTSEAAEEEGKIN